MKFAETLKRQEREMAEKYSPCKTCDEKKLKGWDVICTKFNKYLIIGQLNSYESDYYQLPECGKES